MKKKNGFTLMEMLAVVIILGVILVIAIPSVNNLINKNRTKMYQTHMSLVEEKTKIFADKFKGELTSTSDTCFKINYQDLVKYHYVTEQDVTCKGSIILTKSGNGKSFSRDYYLSCKDKNGEVLDNSFLHDDSFHDSNLTPNNCSSFEVK